MVTELAIYTCISPEYDMIEDRNKNRLLVLPVSHATLNCLLFMREVVAKTTVH